MSMVSYKAGPRQAQDRRVPVQVQEGGGGADRVCPVADPGSIQEGTTINMGLPNKYFF
jgi:hypothetical protein